MDCDFLQGTKPYYELDISTIGAVRSDFNFDDLTNSLSGGPIGVWGFMHQELSTIFSESWLNYMENIGLPVGTCLLFYRTRDFIYPEAHVDIAKVNHAVTHYAINWTLDDRDDSEMVWYSYPTETQTLIQHIPAISPFMSPIDIPYTSWPLENFLDREICRHVLGTKPTLVNTSMPHNVETKTRDRWCVSVRFQRKAFDNAGESWIRTVEFFKPWMKNADR